MDQDNATPDIRKADLSDLAWRVLRDSTKTGKKIPYAAVPYLNSMRSLTTFDDKYGMESARNIVLYFLGNFSSYRTPVGKEVREELKRRLAGK